MSNESPIALQEFLDKDIDALPDAPTREILPAGKHVLKILDISTKELAGKNALIFQFQHLATAELANASDAAPKEGTKYEELFFTDSESGLGNLKAYLANVKVPGVKLSETLNNLVGQQVSVTTNVRQWKNKTSGEQQTGWSTVGGLNLAS